MTKEEFGLELFEAIKCVGGILCLQDQYNHAVHTEDRVQQRAILARKQQVVQELTAALHALSPSDLADVLQHYPFVPTLSA